MTMEGDLQKFKDALDDAVYRQFLKENKKVKDPDKAMIRIVSEFLENNPELKESFIKRMGETLESIVISMQPADSLSPKELSARIAPSIEITIQKGKL